MRILKENHQGLSTFLAMALIPLSGFATDIYLPSLPAMALSLHVSMGAVQLSLVLFMFSTGISQLFVGTFLDSFGRFKISLVSLAIFSISSFANALAPNIYLIYAMRVLQGIVIALIVVSKRAYFVDLYTGNRLKGYISLFAIIWSCAPVIAPFIGGYLQQVFGWQSNFYFLGLLSILLLILELIFSGETLKTFQPFNIKSITHTYLNMARSADFMLGLLIVGACFAVVVIYSLSSPFIIEKTLGYSAVTTGYSSLLSGLAIMTGGIVAKKLIKKPLDRKVIVALSLQVIMVLLMIITSDFLSNIYTLICFTVIIHICGGFVFNIIYGYCLGRFTKHAGVSSGITGGAMYMISSLFSYSLANLFAVKNQMLLGVANACLIVTIVALFVLFIRAKGKLRTNQPA